MVSAPPVMPAVPGHVRAQRGGDRDGVVHADARQHLAVHLDARHADGRAAAVGLLQRRTAPSGLTPADVRAQVLAERGQDPAAAQRRARGAAADAHHVAGRRLEAQVRIAGGDAVQLAVPGARLVGDVLERGDRQVAVGGLGALEDLHRVARVVVLACQDRVERREVDRLERVEGAVRARGGRSGAAPTPRAARRTARPGPSGRGSGCACPRRPCRCTRWGRRRRTGSRSRT